MIPVGIVGATGYVGCELIRLLTNHKDVSIEAIASSSSEGESIEKLYGNFKNIVPLKCSSIDETLKRSKVVFLSLPSGMSEDIAEKCINNDIVCIDMGADFRLDNEDDYIKYYGNKYTKPELHKKSVYGLPEVYRKEIIGAKIIGNPGCYATSIELALIPALGKKLIDIRSIVCDSKSGTTGAGRSLSSTTHFPECNESLSPYKIATHRHTPEIEQVLKHAASTPVSITFVPHLLPINRGILSTIYCSLSDYADIDEVYKVYSDFYRDEEFVRVLDIGQTACIRNVKYSNYCDISIHIDERNRKLILVSAIDNMVKGSAGQAIQNMNIALGLSEHEGLQAVPPAF